MIENRKTKIICTIGPVSESKEMMTKLVENGMNIIRLNFSHGDYEDMEIVLTIFVKLLKKLEKM